MKLRNNAARMIVIHQGLLLVMERWRRDEKTGKLLHYFSIPGGGIEPGETPGQTAVREVWEEMSIKVGLGREVAVVEDSHGTSHRYFLGDYVSGTPSLHPESPEALKMTADNQFAPGWLSLSELDTANFYPIYLKILPLVQEIANGNIPSRPWRISLDTL